MTDTPPTTPVRFTTREELAALAGFARQIERLSPAGRAWLAAYVTSTDTGQS